VSSPPLTRRARSLHPASRARRGTDESRGRAMTEARSFVQIHIRAARSAGRRPMRILIANKFFFRNGGSESVMFAERRYLQEAGVSVIDFSMHDERNLPSDYASYFVAHRSYAAEPQGLLRRAHAALSLIHSREAVDRIVELIDTARPDLLHCHNVYHQLTPSIIGAARDRGVPVVLTLHDYKPICPIYTRLRRGRPCSDCLDQRFLNVLRHRCADGSLARSALLYAEAAAHKLMRSYEKVDAAIAPSRFMYRA